ncbi:kelch-like protein 24 [Oculina patagonica]
MDNYVSGAHDNQEHTMINEDFKDELLHKLNDLRETNILCDTTIRAQGQDFTAHKCVLSAASAYFRAMFTSQMKETESNVVELQEAKSSTISDVLEFIYTGKASIDSSNAQDLIMIADYLIIPSLKTKASLFLQGSINASNCLALESFASQYNCESLKQAAVTYKFKNFVAFTKSEVFRMLDFEKLKELICMDEIDVSEEEEVYQAVIAWVKHDLPSRECLLPELLKCVRLFSMSKYTLRKILNEELVSKDLTCTKVVINALDCCLFPDRFREMPLKPRLSLDKYERVVVITGGSNSEDILKDTMCFVPSTMTWGFLPMMPSYATECGAAAVCGGLLYVLGEKFDGNNSHSMCIFNPNQNKWSSHDITLNLRDFSVTCFNEELYVIGGEGSWHDVQIFNPVRDEWRQAAPMESRRADHSAVVLQDHIYVIAGHNGEVCLNSVECYNPLSGQWNKVSSISKVRRSAAAATAGERIVAVGGFGDMSRLTIEPSCEVFELNTNQWSLVSIPGVPRACGSAVSINDMIYLFGGEDEEECLATVECFDIRSNKWHEMANMPNHCSSLQASLLKLPKKYIALASY